MQVLKTLVVAAALVPVLAFAGTPKQGSYLISGIQTICIVADGTWHGESFTPWSGQWSMAGKTLLMRGNYSAGNDAMNYTGNTANGFNGDWQEWHDDQSYEYAQASTLVFQSSVCTAATEGASANAQGNPSAQ